MYFTWAGKGEKTGKKMPHAGIDSEPKTLFFIFAGNRYRVNLIFVLYQIYDIFKAFYVLKTENNNTIYVLYMGENATFQSRIQDSVDVCGVQ